MLCSPVESLSGTHKAGFKSQLQRILAEAGNQEFTICWATHAELYDPACLKKKKVMVHDFDPST